MNVLIYVGNIIHSIGTLFLTEKEILHTILEVIFDLK